MPASCTTSLLYVNLSKNSFFCACHQFCGESECKGTHFFDTTKENPCFFSFLRIIFPFL